MARKPEARTGTVRAAVSKKLKTEIVRVADRHRATVAEVVEGCLEGLLSQSQLESTFLNQRLREANVAAAAVSDGQM